MSKLPFPPPTDNLLQAMKEYFICVANPSEMGIDLFDGLKEKEKLLASITHEMIYESLGDEYMEQELLVEETIGKQGVLDILLGDTKPLPDPMLTQLPSVTIYLVDYSSGSSSSSSSSSASQDNQVLSVNTWYQMFGVASGGDFDLRNFEFAWSTPVVPAGGYAGITNENVMTEQSYLEVQSKIRFDTVGLYTINFLLTHTTQGLTFQDTLTVRVE
jgi:hypothetical protein